MAPAPASILLLALSYCSAAAAAAASAASASTAGAAKNGTLPTPLSNKDYYHPSHGFENTGAKFAALVFGSSMVVWCVLAAIDTLDERWERRARASKSGAAGGGGADPAYAPVSLNADSDAEENSLVREAQGDGGGEVQRPAAARAVSSPAASGKFTAAELTYPSMRLLFSHASQLGLLLWYVEKREREKEREREREREREMTT